MRLLYLIPTVPTLSLRRPYCITTASLQRPYGVPTASLRQPLTVPMASLHRPYCNMQYVNEIIVSYTYGPYSICTLFSTYCTQTVPTLGLLYTYMECS